jgi:purine catabolism regulator
VAVTVGEIAAMPHLGITVLAGAAGLSREVEWAHVCELEDPTPWLDGPGLVLTTGLAISAQPGDQCRYLQRLAGAGLAAVAIARGMSAPALSQPMLQAADTLGFPLLEVAYEVPYLAITSVVTAANRERSERRLLSYLRIFDTLRLATSQGLGAPQLFRRLADIAGYQLHLCSPSGRPLIDNIPGGPPGWQPPAPGSDPVRAEAGWLTVPVPLRGRIAGYLVAAPQPGRDGLGLLAVRHIATIAALELAILQREREALRREGAETLGEMLTGMLDADAVRARLHLAGLNPAKHLLLAAVSSDRGRDTGLPARLLENGIPHLILQQRELYVLLHEPATGLDVLTATPGSFAGVSKPFRAGQSLDAPRRQALWALRYARSHHRSLAEFSRMQHAANWLPADPRARSSIADEVLGPLTEHDLAHGTDLQHTLVVLLDRDRNITATARALGVHRNTVLHRIAQIEAITGRDLRRVHDLAELWLALSARDL